MDIKRTIVIPEQSFFLFGPRGTGKTTWLKKNFVDSIYIDLLDDGLYRKLLNKPESLKEFILPHKSKYIIIDEIQKVPSLLSVVHKLMEEEKSLSFILTGSSSRKIKREGADLLAARALLYQCHPFMACELGDAFKLQDCLKKGMLPVVFFQKNPDKSLETYIRLYLKEELLMEGLVRNLANFSRFMEAMSFSHAQVLNLSEVARESEVSRKTVEGYLEILKDLLLAYTIPVFSKKAKRNLIKHEKFYYFDTGVFHTLRPKGPLDKLSEIGGAALEGLVLQHLKAWSDYQSERVKIYYWRTKNKLEVDFVLYGENHFFAIEVKHSDKISPNDLKGLKSFLVDYPQAQPILIYRGDRLIIKDDIHCVPVESFLINLKPGKAINL